MMAEFDVDLDGKVTFEEYLASICGQGWVLDGPPTHTEPIKYMVALDGSEISWKAFRHVARMLRKIDEEKSKNDTLVVFHVTNPWRYELKGSKYHPDAIKAAFESEAVKCNINSNHEIEFVVQEKAGADDKICNKIRDYADENSDCLVLGSFGAKREEAEKYDTAGSTATAVTAGCKAVTVLVKQQSRTLPLKKPTRYLVAVDGSDLSHCAIEETLRYMKKGDYIQVVYVEKAGGLDGQSLIERYDKWLVDKQVKGTCKTIKQVENVSIADEILDVAETGSELDNFGFVHVIVIGSNGLSRALPPRGSEDYWEYRSNKRASNRQGSVAVGVIAGASKCSVMCITVDSLLSGAVKSMNFQEWFDATSGF